MSKTLVKKTIKKTPQKQTKLVYILILCRTCYELNFCTDESTVKCIIVNIRSNLGYVLIPPGTVKNINSSQCVFFWITK